MGCSQLASAQYKSRYDNVAKYIHWLLYGKYNIGQEGNWWKHSPGSVVQNDSVKILWDFNIFVDHLIYARWPDIVVIDKDASLVVLIDVSIPANTYQLRRKKNCLSTKQSNFL